MTPIIGRDHFPRRTFRTLEDAFGYGARLTVDERRRADFWDRVVGVTCAVLLIAIVAYLALERLT